MTTQRVIIDAGVLTGVIRKRDQWNFWSSQAATEFPGPYSTCEPVITEASFLLDGAPDSQQRLMEMVENGVIVIDFALSAEVSAVRTLMRKYRDSRMSFADACIVRMSELIENSVVFTVDRDFLVYRKHGRQRIPLIAPFET